VVGSFRTRLADQAPRPGYGDFELEARRRSGDGRKIGGIALTEDHLMLPGKSISGVSAGG
jgi:hypothetical protein